MNNATHVLAVIIGFCMAMVTTTGLPGWGFGVVFSFLAIVALTIFRKATK